MSACVIDASAVLAYLFGERGGDEAEVWMGRGAAISTVNAQEVIARLIDRDVRAGRGLDQAVADAVRDFDGLVLEIVDLTMEDAVAAAAFAPLQRSNDLSAGDRCCLALGKRLGIPVVHAEQKWQPLAGDLSHDLVLVREAH